MTEEEKRELDSCIISEKMLEGAALETVQRYGSAVKEHLVAYTGVDNENGKILTKGLKDISQYKISDNPSYAQANIKQQAGFSAEVKTVARRNTEKIINRDNTKTFRTDDLGNVNDPLYDLVDIDFNGNRIIGTESQMKFVGNNPEELLQKLNSKKFQKYIDADALLDVADDDYEALLGKNGTTGIIDIKIDELKKQIKKAENNGKHEVVIKKQEQIEKYEKIRGNLRKTGMTRQEAIEARISPKISTAKDILSVSHRAGKEQVQYGIAVSGSVALIKNVVACIKREKEYKEAMTDVVVSTGRGAAISYATAFSGSAIKGMLQNSASAYQRSLAKTNFVSGIVTTTMDIGRTMTKYIKGDIDGKECVELLGEHGVGEIGSAMFATIGAASVAGTSSALVTIAASMTGATLGYAAATAVYKELSIALKEYEYAKERRIKIEAEVEEAVDLIRQYREEMNRITSEYLTKSIEVFDEGFRAMDKAIMEDDINGFIHGNLKIQEILGYKLQYSTQEEFDELMLSDVAFKL